MSAARFIAVVVVLTFTSMPVFAQPLGTFRWNLAPFCGVITLTVTQQGGVFTLDGFEEQCGGNPRLPTVGIAIPQASGAIWLGLTAVNDQGASLDTIAFLSPATLGGTWRDSASNSGTLVFNPGTPSGGPRPFPASATLPSAFTFQTDGGFAAGGTQGVGSIPIAGAGTRMLWYPGRAALRAGTVSGTQWDSASVGIGSVALGTNVLASGPGAVALGNGTTASGTVSTALGNGTTASGFASTAMGNSSVASSTFSTAIGDHTSAGGGGSVALGSYAATTLPGTFVFGDASTVVEVSPTLTNQFIARVANGARFYTNNTLTAGVTLPAGGGAWASISDVNMKEHFHDLNGDEVLAKLAAMPVREWSYKSQDASIRHAGPTAQDFHAAFGLGEDPLKITTIDADGIALRAIQALSEQLTALRERIAQLEAQRR